MYVLKKKQDNSGPSIWDKQVNLGNNINNAKP